MDREVDLTFAQRGVEFLGPQGLAADFGQRAVLYPVAAGEDGQDLDRIHAPAMRGDQPVARLMRLRHGEGGAACAKPQGARRR